MFTFMELKVLKLSAKGFTNQQVANKLFISLSTVKKHLSSMYEKSAVEDNKIVNLIRYGLKEQLITIQDFLVN